MADDKVAKAMEAAAIEICPETTEGGWMGPCCGAPSRCTVNKEWGQQHLSVAKAAIVAYLREMDEPTEDMEFAGNLEFPKFVVNADTHDADGPAAIFKAMRLSEIQALEDES